MVRAYGDSELKLIETITDQILKFKAESKWNVSPSHVWELLDLLEVGEKMDSHSSFEEFQFDGQRNSMRALKILRVEMMKRRKMTDTKASFVKVSCDNFRSAGKITKQ